MSAADDNRDLDLVDDEPYDNGYDDDEEEDFDCHRGPDGTCGLAGTEECDWQCPYSRR